MPGSSEYGKTPQRWNFASRTNATNSSNSATLFTVLAAPTISKNLVTSFGGGVYVNTGFNYCYQQQWIQTRHGMRLRTVNVCAY